MRQRIPAAERFAGLETGGSAPANVPLPHNAHVHMPPNFSAFDTVEQVVELAAQQHMALVCASNYYDHRVYEPFARRCFDAGVFPLFGLEIILYDEGLARRRVRTNDPNNPGRVYLCGLGTPFIGQPPAGVADTLGLIRRNDERRMRAMIDRINGVLDVRGVGCRLAYEAIVDGLVRRHGAEADSIVLQERHLAQALQETLFATAESDPSVLDRAAPGALKTPGDPVKVQNDLRSHLMKAGGPAYVDEEFVDFATAKAVILGLGGIPCYPILGDGASPLTEFEADVDTLIESLRAWGVHMAQFIPRRNSLELVERYAEPLRDAGIVLTVGTEHNTLELIPLQPACAGGVALTPRLMELFFEGACISAAHQVLVSRGLPGYVDGAGNRVGDSADLAGIGAGLIGQVVG